MSAATTRDPLPPLPTGFPVGPRAIASSELVAAVTREFGLPPITAIADLGGAYNLNLRLTTQSATYVARAYRPWVTRTRLESMQEIKRQLADLQIPVVLPLRTLDGRTCVEWQQRMIELEPYRPHTDGSALGWGSWRRAFRFLGKLHHALLDVAVRAMPSPVVENYALPDQLFGWVTYVRQRLQSTEGADHVDAVAVCNTAEGMLVDINEWWQRDGHCLPAHLVHGDYGVGNLLWDGNQIAAVVDLDLTAVHERLFDIAYALFWMLSRMQPSVPYEQRAWMRMSDMLSEYALGRGEVLTPLERQSLTIEMARVPLYWIGEAAFLPDAAGAVLSPAADVAFAHWILAHRRDLPPCDTIS